jgi:hypothetical protein
MELEQAVKQLANLVKNSTALDEFKHIDLALAPAAEQEKYLEALVIVRENITRGTLTQDKLAKILFE